MKNKIIEIKFEKLIKFLIIKKLDCNSFLVKVVDGDRWFPLNKHYIIREGMLVEELSDNINNITDKKKTAKYKKTSK